MEQCYRDVLRIAWNMTLDSQLQEFNRLVPLTGPVSVNFTCCQNFLLSRQMVHLRPLSVWTRLYEIITLQNVCHEGNIDYKNLFVKTNIGNEQWNDNGRHTQGNAMEHLAHVVYGNLPLQMEKPTMESVCKQFFPNCEGSPCDENELKSLPLLVGG